MQNGSLITMRVCKNCRTADSAGWLLCPLFFWHIGFLIVIAQVRTWNFPALVKYLTPLNGLYFSPYMSRRLTLRPVQRGEKQSEQPLKMPIDDINSDNFNLNNITTNTMLPLQ